MTGDRQGGEAKGNAAVASRQTSLEEADEIEGNVLLEKGTATVDFTYRACHIVLSTTF